MRQARLQLAACAAVIAYMLTYVGVDYGKLPRVLYDPLRRTFTFGAPSGGVAIGYMGQWLWAGAAAVVCGGCTYEIGRASCRERV